MNKVFELYLANVQGDEDRYAALSLPATPYEMQDALERVGCHSTKDVYFQVEEYLDQVVEPVLRANQDQLGARAQLSV